MDIAIIQVIAYTTLTAASLTVAVVSLFLAYWQHVGWMPLILIVESHIKLADIDGDKPPQYYFIALNFEVWNRRKYPIAIRDIRMDSTSFRFRRVIKDEKFEEGWSDHPTGGSLHDQRSLDANSHYQWTFSGPFVLDDPERINDPFEISVRYFDPRTSKHRLLKKQSSLPALFEGDRDTTR